MGRIAGALWAPIFTLQSISAASAAEAPVSLPATSKWQVDYADDSCKLARAFGTGDEMVVMILTRFEPGNEQSISLAGKPLAKIAPERAVIQFGPGGSRYDDYFAPGSLGALSPALFRTNTMVSAGNAPPPVEGNRSDPEQRADWKLAMITAPAPTAAEEAIKFLDIGQGRSMRYRLDLGSMAAPLAALRTCTDELVTHWGIEPAGLQNLASLPVPLTSPGNWLSYKDYPSDLVRKGAQGVVDFRLSVNAAGVPTQCHIQQASQPEGFADVVCKRIMQRARFTPATDRSGSPVASYYRNTVKFLIG